VLRTAGILPLPRSRGALEAELARLDRELAATPLPRARRLFAIERRRVVVALELAE
jgi:hypothetical protein